MKKKKIYQTKSYLMRKYYIGMIDNVVIPTESAKKDVFCTLKSICSALDVNYRECKTGVRNWGNKSIIECSIIPGDYKGGKFSGKNAGEYESSFVKHRNDIEYDENV